ncbi:MAG: hypothetical protein ACYSU0_11745 [Planctomycetota bacterium]|jgi:hypothetical protein
MTDSLDNSPRFPYVGALLCAACVGAAVWTWMRYSYAWDATHGTPVFFDARGMGPYLGVRGQVRRDTLAWDTMISRPEVWLGVVNGGNFPLLLSEEDAAEPDSRTRWTGRLVRWHSQYESDYIDATASRFTGASIAGLVVGAMGVFVFTVALRHWLWERRTFREEARA